jgi:very-short-patch-repair endonuclease
MVNEKIFNQKRQKIIRQELRNNTPDPEKILWEKLRAQQRGIKFRRQHGIGRYIADFYAPDSSLVIEIDGDSHFEKDAIEYDRIRNEFMRSMGLTVLRFTNQDVIYNLEAVIDEIDLAIGKQTPP